MGIIEGIKKGIGDVVKGIKETIKPTPPPSPIVVTPPIPKISIPTPVAKPVTPISLKPSLPTPAKAGQVTPSVSPPKVDIRREEVGKQITEITKEQMKTTSPFGTKIETPSQPMFFDPYEQRWRYGTIKEVDRTITEVTPTGLTRTGGGQTRTETPEASYQYDVSAMEKQLKGTPEFTSGVMTVKREGEKLIIEQPKHEITLMEGYDVAEMEKQLREDPATSLGLITVKKEGGKLIVEKPIYAETILPFGTMAKEQEMKKIEKIYEKATPMEKAGLQAQFFASHVFSGKGVEAIISKEKREEYVKEQMFKATKPREFVGGELWSTATEGISMPFVAYTTGYGVQQLTKLPAVTKIGVAGAKAISKVKIAKPVLEFAVTHPKATAALVMGGLEGVKVAEMRTGKYLTLKGIETGEKKSYPYIAGEVGKDVLAMVSFGAGWKAGVREGLPKVQITKSEIVTEKEMKIGQKAPYEIKGKVIDPKSQKLVGEVKATGIMEKIGEDTSGKSIFKIHGEREFTLKGVKDITETTEFAGRSITKKLPSPVTFKDFTPDYQVSGARLADVKKGLKISFIQDVQRGSQPLVKAVVELEKPSEAVTLSQKTASIYYEDPFSEQATKKVMGRFIPVERETFFADIGGGVSAKEKALQLGKTVVYELPARPSKEVIPFIEGGKTVTKTFTGVSETTKELGKLLSATGEVVSKKVTEQISKTVTMPFIPVFSPTKKETKLVSATKQVTIRKQEEFLPTISATKLFYGRKEEVKPLPSLITFPVTEVQKPIVTTVQEFKLEQELLPRVTPVTKVIPKTKTTPIVTPITWITPPVTTPPPIIPIDFGLPEGFGAKRRKPSVMLKRKTRYEPSLTAVMFGIKRKKGAKMPNIFTGFEVRKL